jgi:signal transduction histidine kinase
LDDLGLFAALRQLVIDWERRTGLRIDFEAMGPERERLEPELESLLYRVIQEALTNVARHAHAKRVSLVLERFDSQIIAVIEDDGVGFDTTAAASGRLGLVGMRERVRLVGGEIEIESEPGSGTTVIVRLST